MKIGVVYLTLSGTTERIAREFKNLDPSIVLIPIRVLDTIPRYRWRQILKYGAKTIMNRPITYHCEVSIIDSLDAVIIGSPIWVGRIPSPIRNIISEVDLSNKKVAAFCTYDTHPGDFRDQLFAFTDSALFSDFIAFREPLDFNDPGFKNSIKTLLNSFSGQNTSG